MCLRLETIFVLIFGLWQAANIYLQSDQLQWTMRTLKALTNTDYSKAIPWIHALKSVPSFSKIISLGESGA